MEKYLRLAEEKDLSHILQILNEEILHSTVVYDTTAKTLEQQIQWFEQKQKDDFPVMVAEVEGKVLAYGSYGKFRPWEAFHPTIEHSLYVAKEARGNGLGKILLQELIKRAKTDGFHSMIAGIDASNKHSYEFHQRNGFVEVGKIKEAGYKFNTWLDLVFMQLML